MTPCKIQNFLCRQLHTSIIVLRFASFPHIALLGKSSSSSIIPCLQYFINNFVIPFLVVGRKAVKMVRKWVPLEIVSEILEMDIKCLLWYLEFEIAPARSLYREQVKDWKTIIPQVLYRRLLWWTWSNQKHKQKSYFSKDKHTYIHSKIHTFSWYLELALG